MEILGILDLPNLLIVIIAFVFTVCIYTWYKQSLFKRLGIPTKPTLFFFGDIIEMTRKGFTYLDDKAIKENGKVFGTYLGNVPSLVVSDTDMIKQIMITDFSRFSDRNHLVDMTDRWRENVVLAHGKEWKFHRSTLSPAFTAGRLRGMTPYIHKCLDTLYGLLDQKIEQHPEGFDVIDNLKAYALDVIISTGFGLEVDAQSGDSNNQFMKYGQEFFEYKGMKSPKLALQIFFPDLVKLFPSYFRANIVSDQCYDYYKSVLQHAMEERRQEDSVHKDLLQQIINAHKIDADGELEDEETHEPKLAGGKRRGLTDNEVLTNAMMFMVAGYDTAATSLCWLVYELALNTDCQEKLVQEIDAEVGDEKATYDNVYKLEYLDMVVKEALRLHSPAQRAGRVAQEDVVINGVQIPKGMDIIVPTLALHYDPEHWEDPYMFKPERFAPENRDKINQFAYLPFGIGPRNCLGKRLGLLEVKATLASLLQKYKIHQTDKLKVPMPASKEVIRKPAKPIFVRLEKRTKI